MKYLWDFIFGVLLIGGAPWSVIALVTVVGDLIQKLFHVVIPDGVSIFAGFMSLALGFAAFIGAIMFRFGRRIIPRGFLVGEVLLGLFGAVVLFVFYGVLLHSIID